MSDAAGFSYKYMFLLITALHCLTVVSTFAFLPKGYISKPAPQVVEPETADACPAAVELPSLRSCILQPMFITHVIWLIMLQLRFFYFIGTINPYLDRTFNGDDAMGRYLPVIC